MTSKLSGVRVCYVEIHRDFDCVDGEDVEEIIKDAGLMITKRFDSRPIVKAERLS